MVDGSMTSGRVDDDFDVSMCDVVTACSYIIEFKMTYPFIVVVPSHTPREPVIEMQF